MATPDYILRDQAETLLRELGVRSPDDRRPREWGDRTTEPLTDAAYDRVHALVVAGLKAELATRTAA